MQTTGKKYEQLRMLRLKFSGCDAREAKNIIDEFKLNEEYKKKVELQIKKEAYEDSALRLKHSIDAAKIAGADTSKMEESFEKLTREIKQVNEELDEFDNEKLSVKEYYEQLHEILFEEKKSFDEIDLAKVNAEYKNFFLLLSGNSESSANS